MNKIINRYIITKFSKTIFNTLLIFSALGILLNLFEEIEFVKYLNLPIMTPIILSLSFVPSLLMELLPFIVFLSAMFYFLDIRSSKDLLAMKVFGYSNIKIISIVSFFTFFLGVFFLLFLSPITSILTKYYETEKAVYSKDTDHLFAVNQNGVWIRETNDLGYKIINAQKLKNEHLSKISIYVFENGKIKKIIESESALISTKPWKMKNVYIQDVEKQNNIFLDTYDFKTEQTLEKINSLYRNLNTISFLDLILDYSKLHETGYSKKILNEKINKYISLPVFLFLMVVLAAIFTIGSLKNKQNFYYILISILTCAVIYFFKDFSFILGKTQRIGLTLSVWMPIIIISLFCTIGVIQINEK